MKADVGTRTRFDRNMSWRTIWLGTALSALGILYMLTASWTVDSVGRDALSVALPAWHLVDNGSIELGEFADSGAWVLEGPDGAWYSNRAPGLIGFAVVGYLLASPLMDGFSIWPSTLIAVMSVVAALAVLVAAIRRIAPATPPLVLLLTGLGTALWAVASDEIWPHGPAALMIAVALLSLSHDRFDLAGLALAVGILVRPPIAVIALVLGMGLGIKRKTWRPVVQIGVPCFVAVAALLVYAHALFGVWSPFALYSPVGNMGFRASAGGWISNILGSLFSPRHGLLIWSPWLIVALVGIPRVWRTLPDWARLSALAGLGYLVVHMGINRASGGLPFNYRYSIAAVVVALPALTSALPRLLKSKVFVAVLVIAGVASLALQGSAAWLAECSGIGTSQPVCSLFGL